MAVIDFHSHILPGIDDGSKSVNMSMKMLGMASEQGVQVMVATPHFYASRHRIEVFLERRQRSFEALQAQKGDFGPELKLGAEVAWFPGISRADRLEDLFIADTRVMLLEMPFAPWTDEMTDEVTNLLRKRDVQVVLAHVERYLDYAENRKKIESLLEMPLYVQINAEALLSWRKKRIVMKMFNQKKAHFLGSDCHRTEKREPNLGKGRAVLQKKFGKAFLEKMDEEGSRLLHLGG